MQNNTFFEDSDSNNIIVIEELSSTNDYLKQLLSKVKPLAPYTVIMANNQTDGKGQRGNVWKTEPHQNVTASFLLFPQNLPLTKQFQLSIIASMSVYDLLNEYCTGEINIKWPNDILINHKKVAGILIENKISSHTIAQSIVGIGINVFQKIFPSEIQHKTTSLSLESPNLTVNLLEIVQALQQKLRYYTEETEKNPNKILKLYNDRLYNRNIFANYRYKEEVVQGKIIEVKEDGLLRIEINQAIEIVDLKGITYIL